MKHEEERVVARKKKVQEAQRKLAIFLIAEAEKKKALSEKDRRLKSAVASLTKAEFSDEQNEKRDARMYAQISNVFRKLVAEKLAEQPDFALEKQEESIVKGEQSKVKKDKSSVSLALLREHDVASALRLLNAEDSSAQSSLKNDLQKILAQQRNLDHRRDELDKVLKQSKDREESRFDRLDKTLDEEKKYVGMVAALNKGEASAKSRWLKELGFLSNFKQRIQSELANINRVIGMQRQSMGRAERALAQEQRQMSSLAKNMQAVQNKIKMDKARKLLKEALVDEAKLKQYQVLETAQRNKIAQEMVSDKLYKTEMARATKKKRYFDSKMKGFSRAYQAFSKARSAEISGFNLQRSEARKLLEEDVGQLQSKEDRDRLNVLLQVEEEQPLQIRDLEGKERSLKHQVLQMQQAVNAAKNRIVQLKRIALFKRPRVEMKPFR